MRYVIDGCNFLLQQLERYDQTSREQLQQLLTVFQQRRKCEIYLYFDSKEALMQQVEFIHKGFQIRYVPTPADTSIIKFITQEENKRNIVVVSDDRAHIISQAKSLGVKTIDTDTFAHNLIFIQETKQSAPPEKPEKESESAKKRYLDLWKEPKHHDTELERYLRLWGGEEEDR